MGGRELEQSGLENDSQRKITKLKEKQNAGPSNFCICPLPSPQEARHGTERSGLSATPRGEVGRRLALPNHQSYWLHTLGKDHGVHSDPRYGGRSTQSFYLEGGGVGTRDGVP